MFELVSPELETRLADEATRKRYLLLDRHPDFAGHWIVEGFSNEFLFDLGEILGSYRALAPTGLQHFLEAAEDCGYHVAFFEDPTTALEDYRHLNAEPEVEINSTFPHTIKGMLPYQVQGFNMVKDLDYAVLRWDTGTGKTVGAAALVKYHQQRRDFDICFFVVKKHNKVNTVRKLQTLAGVEAEYLRGARDQRERLYARLDMAIAAHQSPVVVLNYEQLKDFTTRDAKKKLVLTNWGNTFFDGMNVMFVWDEMPTKLKTRTSELYKRICKLLYRTDAPQVNWKRPRPQHIRSYMLSATPIENSPEDLFNCLPVGTPVEGIGNIHSAYCADYEGPLVKFVTASATSLTIGPNHPVLTQRGWVKAQELHKGDQVFRRAIQRVIGTVEDLDQPPSLIEDVFDTLRASSKNIRMKRASTFEFHGDGRYFKGQVDVVGTNSLLRDTSYTQVRQESLHSGLSFSHANTHSSLLSQGSLDFGLDSVMSAKARPLGIDYGLQRGVGPSRAHNDSHLLEPTGDHFLAHVEFTGQSTTGNVLLKITPFDLRQRQRNTSSMSRAHLDPGLFETTRNSSRMHANIGSNDANRFSCTVTADEIVDVEIIDYVGQIYDLSTSSGTYYGNGLVVSNCVRLMDGGRTYGTVSEFNATYVSSWNFYDDTKPETFHNLERMRLKAAHFIHQVDKTDPDIAAVFPKVVEELVYIDWDDTNAALYRRIQDMAKKVTDEDEDVPIFSLIGTLQMMCDAPAMIKDSAARRELWEEAHDVWEEDQVGREPTADGSEFALKVAEELNERLTNVKHPKIDRLREILLERHPGDQVAIYTKYNEVLMPYLEAALRQWGVSYVRYGGTERQKQAAQDCFQDGTFRVFISSDAGSDSIDLDAGNVVIDYNLPWKWTTLTQRHNRVHRATSNHETVHFYTLLMENSVEDRVLQIIEKKHGYHNELFDPAAGDFSASARMSREDLMYILTGR